MNTTGKILSLLLLVVSVFSAQELKNGYNRNNLDELRKQIDDIVEDSNLQHAFWGIEIRSLENDEVVYKKNSEKSFVPASTIKLFTTSAALLLLGPTFQYSTEFYSSGKPDNTSIKNLIIKASGDPTFVVSKNESMLLQHPLQSIADSLKKFNVSHIGGNIISDNRIFDNQMYGRGWEQDVLSNWYAPPISSLSLNGNLTHVSVRPTENNFPAYIEVSPYFSGLSLINKVTTLACSGKHENWLKIRKDDSHIFTIYGAIGESETVLKEKLPVADPVKYFMENLNKQIVDSGIEVAGYTTDVTLEKDNFSYENIEYLFSIESDDLQVIVKEINKNSNNLYAEVLLKTLGVELYGSGTSETGIKAVHDVLKNMGININNIQIIDGSGLSRHNLVTPRQVLKLLVYMYKSGEFEHFYNSLPIAGLDGTLSGRMKNSNAENNVRAKPGFLEGVRTLSGYIKTADDEPMAFSIMLNNYHVSSNLANYMFDLICSRLANFKRNIN
ncbi:MAG: peptidase M15 [Melioribacteraceae bacterium]|nr:MAG: peptidase M15 [Melioribacteraceae bacterium]